MTHLDELLQSADYIAGPHDIVVQKIYDRLKKTGLYEDLYHCAEYGKHKYGVKGELDVAGQCNGRLNILEIKYIKNKNTSRKARIQNNRSYEHFTNLGYNVKTFAVYGDTSNPKGYTIKRQH